MIGAIAQSVTRYVLDNRRRRLQQSKNCRKAGARDERKLAES